jgi:hypothetical protein
MAEITAAEVSATISALSAAIAAGSAFLAFQNWRKARFELRQAFFRDIKLWANQVCDLLSEAVHLCDLDPTRTEGEPFFVRRHKLRISLSSMTDSRSASNRLSRQRVLRAKHEADHAGRWLEDSTGPRNSLRNLCFGLRRH